LDALLLDDLRVLRDAGAHVGDGGRGELELVQADEDAAVGEHAVRVLPGVGGTALAEPETFVESHRVRDVGGFDTDFVESSQHWRRSVRGPGACFYVRVAETSADSTRRTHSEISAAPTKQ